MNVLELYSGIGGMHLALEESGVKGKIIASIDINTVANTIYKHNFPNTTLLNKNLQSITSSTINKLNVNTILMSPPCQPFTRNGLQNDTNDPRTSSFMHILEILPDLNINKILIENVKGFETSQTRDILIETLVKCNFVYQEFIISPVQLGIPNSRLRYYCLARRRPDKFDFELSSLMENFPESTTPQSFKIGDILTNTTNYLLPDTVLRKRIKLLDICYKDSRRSCCFTKAYGRYVEGTGSVFCDKTEQDVAEVFQQLESLDNDSLEYLNLARTLNLRFFTPDEILKLMCFPSYFSFPNSVTDKQKYMVLGNSINVKVVAELIKLLK